MTKADTDISIQPSPEKVVPGRAPGFNGQKLTWTNNLSDDVLLIWPHDDAFGNGSKGFVQPIPAGGSLPSQHLNGKAKGDILPYLVWNVGKKRFVSGNSQPEIIIEG